MQYRRARTKGGTYFFTVVTHGRRPFLGEERHVDLLRTCIKAVMERHPFTIDAMVVMPDHIHAIWTLPEDDRNFWNQVEFDKEQIYEAM